MMTPVAFWIVFGVILMIIEIFTPTFFIFWFGLGSLAAAVVAYFHENTLLELVTFIVVSAVFVLSTRKLAKKISGEQVRSINIDEIIGKEAIVIEKVDNKAATGVIKVSGDMWRAVSLDDDMVFEKGDRVTIEKIEGAHAVVKPFEKKPERTSEGELGTESTEKPPEHNEEKAPDSQDQDGETSQNS